MNKIRGSQIEVTPIEIGSTTVYLRKNIERIETTDFSGWEYDEEQITKDNFIARLQVENTLVKEAQAATDTALLEFMETMLLGGI